MNIRPVGDKVLVKIKEVEERTKSGIIIPDSAVDFPIEATVVEVGGGILTYSGTRVSPDVKVGDKILCKKMNNGVEIEINNELHLLITEHDILGVIE